MELNPHDLLEIDCKSDLISYSPLPDWVGISLAKAPYVVVRRVRAEEGLVAVGVRGPKRNERFAAFLPVERIVRRITPEQLAQERKWNNYSKEIFRHLEEVSNLMNKYMLTWGPTGSIGFELTSGKETVTKKSDIDLIIRTSKEFSKEFFQELESELKIIPAQLDVQVEITEGAFSLHEYAASQEKKILLRTMDGPMLKQHSFPGL